MQNVANAVVYNVYFAFFKTKDGSKINQNIFESKKSDDLKSISKSIKTSFFGIEKFPSWLKVFLYGQLYPYDQVRFDLIQPDNNYVISDFLDISIEDQTSRVVAKYKNKNPEEYKNNKIFNIGLSNSKEPSLLVDKKMITNGTSIFAMPFCLSAEEEKLAALMQSNSEEQDTFWNHVSPEFINSVKDVFNISQDIECMGMIDSSFLDSDFLDCSLLAEQAKKIGENNAIVNRHKLNENTNHISVILNKEIVFSYYPLDSFLNQNEYSKESVETWAKHQENIIRRLEAVRVNSVLSCSFNGEILSDIEHLKDYELLSKLHDFNTDDFYHFKHVVKKSKDSAVKKLKAYSINVHYGLIEEELEADEIEDKQFENSDFAILVAYNEKDEVLWYETLYYISLSGLENVKKHIGEYEQKYMSACEFSTYEEVPYSKRRKKVVPPELL